MKPVALPRHVRLAVVLSHPIQYFSPWFRHLASQTDIELHVFYLWDFGVQARFDPGFGKTIQWDIPLLEGYDYTFIPNRSANPGTHHFRGLDNPGLVPALEAWSPDAILLFGYAYVSHWRVLRSRRLSQIPLLLRGDSHDLSRPAGLKPWMARLARSLLFRRFAGFLAVGKANADYYRHCGVPEDRIHFVPHCVDNGRFQEAAPEAFEEAKAWRAELGIPEESLVVLFAGKFEAKKRPLDLLAAFGQAQEALWKTQGPVPVLFFVGSGELEGDLHSSSGDRQGRSIFFAPFQNQSRMPMVYALADILVLPSESETWGLAVNEAMNLGRPVIVSSHVGCGPDLVVSEETGWVFPEGNIAALAATLTQALTLGREGLVSMGRKARLRIDNYSLEAATSGLRATLAKAVLNSSSPGQD